MKTYFISIAILFTFVTTSMAQAPAANDTIQTTENQVTTQQNNEPQQVQPTETSVTKQHHFDRSKLVIGGSFGLAINNDYMSVNVSPQLGYAFNRFFTAGVGISYNYYNYSDINTTFNYAGLNVYGKVNPIRFIAIQVQPEVYYMWGDYSNHSKTKVIPCVLVGAGFTVPTGRSGGFSAMIYYDVVQYKSDGINYSPYGDQLVYSIGYTFGF